ncbi:hypothetical protein AAU61_01055 [Desulfocarbo indianensis]|nr:hypothetical protein AAU61_01055 [Desulfocarbo indianensis]
MHNLCEMYEEVHGVDLDAPVEAVSKFATANGLAVQLANGNVTDLIYPDEYFEAVLLISILEHLRSDELEQAMKEIKRVLKPGGQIVFGVPIESRFMSLAFRILGYDIKKLHFSSHIDVNYAAAKHFHQEKSFFLKHPLFPGAPIYQIGSFRKAIDQKTRRTSADA